MTTPAALAHASEFLDSIDVSPRTKRTYRTALDLLARFMAQRLRADAAENPETIPVSRLNQDSLAQFRLWLRNDRSYSRRTEGTYLAGALRFVEWLDARSLLAQGVSSSRMKLVLSEARSRRRTGYKTQPIKEAVPLVLQYYDDLKLPPAENPRSRQKRLTILRNRALVHTLFASGMRASELASLTRGSCADGAADRILISGKGDKERVVALNSEAQAAIRAYCEERDADSAHRDLASGRSSRRSPEMAAREPLFVRHDIHRNTRISAKTVWLVVSQAARRAGLPEPISPHDFRRYIATSLLSEGMPLESVQAFLGHESIVTTRTVYARTWSEVLDDQVQTYRPSPEQAIKRATKKKTRG